MTITTLFKEKISNVELYAHKVKLRLVGFGGCDKVFLTIIYL